MFRGSFGQTCQVFTRAKETFQKRAELETFSILNKLSAKGETIPEEEKCWTDRERMKKVDRDSYSYKCFSTAYALAYASCMRNGQGLNMLLPIF